jgi:hypothetical protein
VRSARVVKPASTTLATPSGASAAITARICAMQRATRSCAQAASAPGAMSGQ